MKSSIKKIAVIGCGSIGKRHIQNFISLGQEVIAYNRSDSKRFEIEKKFNIPTFSSLNKLYKTFDTDLSVICTPANMHIKNAKLAIENNNHLFIEKPVSLINQSIDDLEKSISKAGLFSHIGCNMRFHYGPQKIKDYLNRKVIGRPIFSKIWCGSFLKNWHPKEDYKKMYSANKKEGGGVLLDLIHEVDLSYWLFKEPERIKAFVSNSQSLGIRTEDIADIIFLYKKNFHLNMNLNYLERPVKRGIFIHGTKGSIEWSLEKNFFIHSNFTNGKITKINPPSKWSHNTMYLEQSKYILDCLNKKKESLNSISESKKIMNLVSKINTSSKLNI